MVGRAGRYAFFSTLALLIFLLFFSVINIRVVRLPVERAIDGKRHQLSIGLSFNLLEEAKPGGDIQDAERLFSKDGIPLSKQSLLLLIAAWHAGSFAYFFQETALGRLSARPLPSPAVNRERERETGVIAFSFFPAEIIGTGIYRRLVIPVTGPAFRKSVPPTSAAK